MRVWWLALILYWSQVHASIQTEMRAEITPTRADTLQGSAATQWELWGPLHLRFSGRGAVRAVDFERLTYAVEPTIDIYSIFELSLRLFHTLRWGETTSTSGAVAFARLHGEIPGILGGSFGAGYLRRWHSLRDVAVVPILGRSTFSENDLAAEIQVWGYLSSDLKIQTTIATDDRYEIYNLNYPLVELAVKWQREIDSWEFFGRTQLLLGFGRPAAYSAGARYNF